MSYFLNLFFVFSILGFAMEQSLLNLFGKRYNSSLLHGPWTIVYGIATLIILFIGDKMKQLFQNKILRFCLFFVTSFLILSILELVAGIAIEKILHITYWDYSNLPLNLGKYICVPVSLIWTVYAVILNYALYPWLKKIIPKIPKWVTIIFVIAFIIDIIYSIYQYLLYV